MRARQGRRVTGCSMAVVSLSAGMPEPDSEEKTPTEKRIQILDACRSSPLLLDAERLSSGRPDAAQAFRSAGPSEESACSDLLAPTR